VACLTADIDIRPGGLIDIALDIVVFFQVGGVTFRAHSIPILTGVGPVQPILWIHRGVRIEMVPFLLFDVPSNGKALQTAARERHKVLLQRVPTKGVGDFKLSHLTARPLGVYKKPAVLSIKTRCSAIDFKNSVVKIPQNGTLIGHVHCMIVV